MTLPGGRQGQILAAALAMLALALVWIAAISPLLDWYGTRAQTLDRMQALGRREAALVQMLPALQSEAAAASGTPARAVLPGDSDAIAGAALQEQVQGMAGAVSAQLTSIETLPAEQVGAYRRIGVRIATNAALTVVIRLLKAIEEAQPSMLIDDIRLTATPIGPQALALPLDAAFTVYAFRVGTGGSAPGGSEP